MELCCLKGVYFAYQRAHDTHCALSIKRAFFRLMSIGVLMVLLSVVVDRTVGLMWCPKKGKRCQAIHSEFRPAHPENDFGGSDLQVEYCSKEEYAESLEIFHDKRTIKLFT